MGLTKQKVIKEVHLSEELMLAHTSAQMNQNQRAFCAFSDIHKDHMAFILSLAWSYSRIKEATPPEWNEWITQTVVLVIWWIILHTPFAPISAIKIPFVCTLGGVNWRWCGKGVSMGTVMSKWGRVQGPRAVMQFVPPFVQITVQIKGCKYDRIDYTWPNEDPVWTRPASKEGLETKTLKIYIFNITLSYCLIVHHLLQTPVCVSICLIFSTK